MLVIYNFNESNNQWFLIEISFLVCLRQWLAVSQEKGRLPNTVSSAGEPFVELSSRIHFFSQPCYCLWAMICLLSFLIIFSFSMQKMLTTCSKRWWLLIFSMRHEKWVVRSLFAVFNGKMRNICLECSKKKNLSMQFHVWICGHQQDGMWSLGEDCIIFQSEAKRAMTIGGFWVTGFVMLNVFHVLLAFGLS